MKIKLAGIIGLTVIDAEYDQETKTDTIWFSNGLRSTLPRDPARTAVMEMDPEDA